MIARRHHAVNRKSKIDFIDATGYPATIMSAACPAAIISACMTAARIHAHNHLGGTTRPCQAVPEMSPPLEGKRYPNYDIQWIRIS
jgi:hypothetical protein